MKGYKVLDLHTRKIFISKNVIFHESIFPFSPHFKKNSPRASIPLPTNIPISTDTNPVLDAYISPINHSNSPSYAEASESQIGAPLVESIEHIEPIDYPIVEPIPKPQAEPIAAPTRRSSRHIHKPSYLQSYHCNQVSIDSPTLSFSTQGTHYPYLLFYHMNIFPIFTNIFAI